MSGFTSFEDFLFSEPNTNSDGDVALEGTEGYENTELTPAAESAIFLGMIQSQCESLEEYSDLVANEAVEWELMGYIESADAAMEAVKKITIQDWKKVNMDRLIGRECIRLSRANKDPNYVPYAKSRAKLHESREKIFTRWYNKAKANVKAALSNARSKASVSKGSSELKKKIDSAYKSAYAGNDPSKSKAPANAGASKVKTHK